MLHSAKEMVKVNNAVLKRLKTLKDLRCRVDQSVNRAACEGRGRVTVHTSQNRPQDVWKVQEELTKLGYKVVVRGAGILQKDCLEMEISWNDR